MKLRRLFLLVWVLLHCPVALSAQEKTFRLGAPQVLVESGFLKHLLPRFSLKTGVRITVVGDADDAEAAFGDEGTPAFRGQGRLWHLVYEKGPHTDRFADWLLSDVGKRTIEAFQPEGTAVFSADVGVEEVAVKAVFAGDAAKGETSRSRCAGAATW